MTGQKYHLGWRHSLCPIFFRAKPIWFSFYAILLFSLFSCRFNDNRIRGHLGCQSSCNSSENPSNGSPEAGDDPLVGLSGGSLIFSTLPTNTNFGSNISGFTVEVRDSSNQVVDTQTTVVTLEIGSDPTHGLARLGGTLSRTTVHGVATFDDITLSQVADNYQLVARANALSSAVSPPFDIVGSATQIYRSVGPGNDQPLASGSSNQMTISNSVATFASPLPDNIGLGDAIQYDSNGGSNGSGSDPVDQIVFIHGRISSTQYKVKKADGSAPVSTISDTDWSVFRAYIGIWEAAGNTGGGTENTGIAASLRNFDSFSNSGGEDLTVTNQIWSIACYADGVEVNPIYIWNWTTDLQRYLRIFTPVYPSEVGVSQRHNGQWNSRAFILGMPTTGGDGNHLSVVTEAVRIDGLQIFIEDDGGSVAGIYLESVIESVVSNNIVRKVENLSFGSGIQIGSYSGVNKVYNNIVFGMEGGNALRFENSGSTSYVFNNTGFNDDYGVRAEAGTVLAKNNLMKTSLTSQNFFGSFDSGSDYNFSDDATVPGGTHDQLSTPIQFLGQLWGDFRLALSGNLALDGGVSLESDLNLGFAMDIRGFPRNQGGQWDAGALEEPELSLSDILSADFNQGTLSSGLEVTGSNTLGVKAKSETAREIQVPDSEMDTTGLVALWHLNETSGQIMDSSGNGNHSVSVTGTPGYGQTGVLNLGMGMVSGNSPVVDFGQITAIEQAPQMTIMAWMKRSNSGGKVLIGVHDLAPIQNIFLELYGSYCNFLVGNSGTGGSKGSILLNDTRWHHLALVFDGTLTGNANRLKGFLDGYQMELSFSGTIPALTPDLVSNFKIGTNNIGEYSDGLVDEVSVWSRALPAAEIEKVYWRQKGPYQPTPSDQFASRIFERPANQQGRWAQLEVETVNPIGKEIPIIDSEIDAYGSGVDMSGLVGLWHLDENSGLIRDSSGRGHDGTVVGNLNFGKTGVFGGALGFNDVDGEMVNVPAHSELEPDDLTISFWFKRDGLQNDFAQMVTKGCCVMWAGANWSYAFEWDTSGMGNSFGFGVDSSVDGYWLVNSGPTPDQVWTHAVGTYNDTTKTLELFINGVSVGTMVMSGTRDKDLVDNLVFGQYGGGSGGAFKGDLDEIAIWSRVLSVSEIQNLYQRGKIRFQYQVRSCQKSDCSDGSFVGPQGSSSDYFTELFSGTTSATRFDLRWLQLTGPYFQYRVTPVVDDSALSPQLDRVRVDFLQSP